MQVRAAAGMERSSYWAQAVGDRVAFCCMLHRFLPASTGMGPRCIPLHRPEADAHRCYVRAPPPPPPPPSCSFTVEWRASKDAGRRADVRISELCLLDPRPLSQHPQHATFKQQLDKAAGIAGDAAGVAAAPAAVAAAPTAFQPRGLAPLLAFPGLQPAAAAAVPQSSEDIPALPPPAPTPPTPHPHTHTPTPTHTFSPTNPCSWQRHVATLCLYVHSLTAHCLALPTSPFLLAAGGNAVPDSPEAISESEAEEEGGAAAAADVPSAVFQFRPPSGAAGPPCSLCKLPTVVQVRARDYRTILYTRPASLTSKRVWDGA